MHIDRLAALTLRVETLQSQGRSLRANRSDAQVLVACMNPLHFVCSYDTGRAGSDLSRRKTITPSFPLGRVSMRHISASDWARRRSQLANADVFFLRTRP